METTENHAATSAQKTRRPRFVQPLEVLLAEQDENLRFEMAQVLREDGHQVIEARDGSDLTADLACAYLAGSESMDPPLLIVDGRLPVAGSLSIVRAARARGLFPRFVLLNASEDMDAHCEARRLGALAVLTKPVDLMALRNVVSGFARSRQYS
jgi:two-component system alkaline phosphatase synthesis response regulator PhoP